jgi:hypothetical protein
MVQGRDEVINYKVHKSRRTPRESWYIVPGTHEPIVDEARFNTAQKLLSLNVRAGVGGNIYPLGGLLKCGECKKSMSRKASRGRVYYCCRTYREKGKQFCGSHSIREETLFNAVLEAVNLQIAQLSDFELLIRRVSEVPSKSRDTETIKKIEEIKKELDTEHLVFDKAYYDYAKGNISEAQFKRIREICERRQAELEGLAETLRHEAVERTTEAKRTYFEDFKTNMRADALTRKLAVDLIESVYVFSDQSLEVSFRFADQLSL